MFYYNVLEEFYKNQVKYLIVGGLSVNLHGVPRVTQDMDIILASDEDNVLKTVKILKELNYKPNIPVEPEELARPAKVKQLVNEKNMIAFSFYNQTENYKVVDIIISHNLNFESAYLNAIIKKVDSFNIYIASIDDVIKMKQGTGREQDKSDIEMLMKVKQFSDKKNG